ncbi:MAG: cytochrome-c peroxidase, partial [Fluviicola sp.]
SFQDASKFVIKMNRILFVILVFISFSFLTKKKFLEYPSSWPEPVYHLQNNKPTSKGISLGRMLFYDPILSSDSTISCASCHSSFTAFTHVDHNLSHGIQDRIGKRNSPTLMNLAWQSNFMWDGAIIILDMQALAPISHPDEMGSSINDVVHKLNHDKFYNKKFQQIYGTKEISGEQVLKVISQFMLTLISSNSKYDRVKNGKEQFSEQEANGYRLFVNNCSSCHTEPLFTNHNFVNNGLKLSQEINDLGRFQITKDAKDSLKFKVPSLRNIEFSYPYMHDGRFKKLSEVLNHYSNGINQSNTLDIRLKNGIQLTANEKVDLISFLLTLTDKEFLFNKNFSYPKKDFDLKRGKGIN